MHICAYVDIAGGASGAGLGSGAETPNTNYWDCRCFASHCLNGSRAGILSDHDESR